MGCCAALLVERPVLQAIMLIPPPKPSDQSSVTATIHASLSMIMQPVVQQRNDRSMGIFAGDKTTVLVVEDEALLRLVAVGELEDAGIVTLEAENGSQALDILSCNRGIDIVFTDIDMPGGINGIELANIVREAYPHIRVIVVSGLSNIKNTALHETIPFYSKPYDMARIIQQMQALDRDAQPEAPLKSGI
jgi:CheY-like chemotaxis protein